MLANQQHTEICLKYEYRNLQQTLLEDIEFIKNKYSQFQSIEMRVRLDINRWGSSQQKSEVVELEPDKLIKLALILEQKNEGMNNNAQIEELNMVCLSGVTQTGHVIECPKNSNLDFILTENEISGAYHACVNEPWKKIVDFNSFDMKINEALSSVMLYPSDLPLQTIYEYKFELLLENSCKDRMNCRMGGKLLKDLLQRHAQSKITLANYSEIMFQIQKYLQMGCKDCQIGQGLANLSKLLAGEIKQKEKIEVEQGCPAATAKSEEEKKSACDSCPMKANCSSSSTEKSESPKKSVQDQQIQHNLGMIKHKILVLSGKGGVGKSTVATQLAVELAGKGFKVGLLDIDIAGPSVPTLLGLQGQRIKLSENSIEPIKMDDNLSVMSIGFLLQNQDDAVIWRGPKKTGLISQFLSQVEWGIDGNLDFLIIDTPPGTSDEHISLSQMLQINSKDGAIIVTTPQEVALADVRKGIQFCRKAEIPVLGVIENMSKFICPKCNNESKIFPSSTGGAELMSVQYGVELLGSIPLKMEISYKLDRGQIVDSNALKEFQDIINNLKQFFPIIKENKPKKQIQQEHFY
eukprot:TRINITY_DN3867_c0_g1_i2.p1 TRINITY_DN3867_c0_g1~~TRINITY_DN3867_c0_g1_i2.p1  ORF type:complete len:578 (-),score=46.60 TRINITY_DN3867_c0_g1_i2:81-1814(-)